MRKDTLKTRLLRSCAASLFGGAALLASAAGDAARADYPDRPVTIIVPWGAGGGTDTIVRFFAVGFEKALGVPVTIVNRAGGNGVVGHSAIANAPPDGYTLGACTSEISYFKTMGLAPLTPASFDLISRIAEMPAGVTARAGGRFPDLMAVVEAMKSEPAGTLTASGSGIGGPWHLAIAGLAKMQDLPADTVKFVPSQGGAPALQDVMAGGIDLFTGSPVEAKSLAEAGKVKVLAVTAKERLAAFPDVPTVKEAIGVDWTLSNWFSLCAPPGLPADVKAKIVAAGEQGHADAEVQKSLRERGITPVWDGPERFSEFANAYAGTAETLLKDLGLAK